MPGVSVTATNASTGFSRTVTTEAAGSYRLTALPVGVYVVAVEITGFQKIDRQGIIVNVGQEVDLDFTLKVASVEETITVTGESPLVQTSNSAVGGVVEIGRIESIPSTVASLPTWRPPFPGRARFHSGPHQEHAVRAADRWRKRPEHQLPDRRGDNNDDTVGGLLQLFPLEPSRSST